MNLETIHGLTTKQDVWYIIERSYPLYIEEPINKYGKGKGNCVDVSILLSKGNPQV